MTDKDRIAQLEAELAKAKRPRKLSCKVGEKGGVSVYGINARFPVTLYKDQWERLLAFASEITAFMEANASRLTVKS